VAVVQPTSALSLSAGASRPTLATLRQVHERARKLKAQQEAQILNHRKASP